MTTEIPRPLPMASTGCACCAPASATDQTAPAVETPASAGTSSTYRVEGMTCGHCAGRVTEAITALEGVTDVDIDLVAGGISTATVTGSAAPETVRAAVEEAGYTLVTD